MTKTDPAVEFPLTKTTMENFARAIFEPVAHGQCCMVVFEPESGKRKRSRFLVNNLSLFKKVLPQDKPVEAYYIDQVELASATPAGYLALIFQTLQPNETHIPSERMLLPKLKEIFANKAKKCHLVLFLGKFDEINYMPGRLAQNLKALWQVDKPSVHFIFLVKKDLVAQEELQKYGELSEAILQNIYHVPSLTDEDVDFIIENGSKRFDVNFTDGQKKIIREVGQRHPHLLKIAFETVAKSSTGLTDDGLRQAILLNPQFQFVNRLIRGETPELSVSQEKDVILHGDRPFGSHLTAKEYALLSHFLKNKGVIVSRDEIADVLWGKNSYEKYSDWAIDQMMSMLRKKLKQAGLGKNLETLKGRGYRFI